MLLCLCDTYIWFNSYIWYLYMILYCTITKVTWRRTNLLVRDNQCLFMHPCVALDLNEHTGVKILGFYIISLCKSVHVWRGEGGQTVKLTNGVRRQAGTAGAVRNFMEGTRVLPFWLMRNGAKAAAYFFPCNGGRAEAAHDENIWIMWRSWGRNRMWTRDSMMQETPPSLPAPDQMGKEGRAVKIGGRQVQV